MLRPPLRKLIDSPVLVVFLASLVLSGIARLGSLINRDGMFYVQIARGFLDGGFSGAYSISPWPFFSILFASISEASGLNLESAGYLLNALFFAGACAFLVDIARKQYPEAVWFVVLTVLALPGLNDYRGELLREYGAWFFTMLALWVASRYSEQQSWKLGVLVFPSVILGALFRHEVVVVFPAVLAWLFFLMPRNQYIRCLFVLCVPFFFALGMVVFAWADFPVVKNSRLVSDLGLLLFPGFDASLNGIRAALPHSTNASAKIILVFGSLAIVPVRFIEKLGLFIVPVLFVLFRFRGFVVLRAGYSPLLWVASAHLLVLGVFVLQLHFLAGRYLAPLYLFLAPAIAYAIYLMVREFSQWRPWVYGALIVFALSNVVSTSPEKTHFVNAGKWLAENIQESPLLYNESGRSAYFAGWRQRYEQQPELRGLLPEAMKRGRYEIAILEVSRKEVGVEEWLAASGLNVAQSFVHENGDRVLVVTVANRVDLP